MTIAPLISSGTGITVTATQSAGAINATNVTAGGTGYTPGSTVTFSVAGSGGGSGAILTGVIGTNGSLATGASTLTITNAGSGYSGTITVGAPQLTTQGGAALVTTTGAIQDTNGVDISGATYLNGNIVWCVDVLSLTAGKFLALALELSANAFGASTIAAVHQFAGQLGQGGTAPAVGNYNVNNDKRSDVVRIELPFSFATYFGQSGGVARVNCTGISGSAGALVQSWFEIG